MTEPVVIPWRDVTRLEPVNGALLPILASVDSLRSAWEEAMQQIAPGISLRLGGEACDDTQSKPASSNGCTTSAGESPKHS